MDTITGAVIVATLSILGLFSCEALRRELTNPELNRWPDEDPPWPRPDPDSPPPPRVEVDETEPDWVCENLGDLVWTRGGIRPAAAESWRRRRWQEGLD